MIFQPNLFIVPSSGPIEINICVIIERSILKNINENLTINLINKGIDIRIARMAKICMKSNAYH